MLDRRNFLVCLRDVDNGQLSILPTTLYSRSPRRHPSSCLIEKIITVFCAVYNHSRDWQKVMFSLPVFTYICLGSVFCGFVRGYSEKNYALYFPNRGVTNYANIWGMRSLTEVTVCFWMKSSSTNDGVPFSYAVQGEANELLIYDHADFLLVIGGTESPRIHESANDGRWHHICVSWRSSDGVWQFYKDGSLHIHTRNLRRGHTIRAGGSLVLGQEQDSLGGSFESHQSFQGSLTNVNVWSYVLPASTIRSLSKSCLSGVGNVYKWSDFIYGVKGKTAVVIPSPCYPLSTRG